MELTDNSEDDNFLKAFHKPESVHNNGIGLQTSVVSQQYHRILKKYRETKV